MCCIFLSNIRCLKESASLLCLQGLKKSFDDEEEKVTDCCSQLIYGSLQQTTVFCLMEAFWVGF